MGRTRNKKGKLFNMLSDKFEITFFYKPSMQSDDVFYYIGLNNSIRLRLKLIGNVIIIDDISPLTVSYIDKLYQTLGELLVNQTLFTVLISILGNTLSFHATCIKYNAIIVEDEHFSTVPDKYYQLMKDYYNNDESKYGFYLLAVNDQISYTNSSEQPVNQVCNTQDKLTYDNISPLDSFKIKCDGLAIIKSNDTRTDMSFMYNDISFRAIYNEDYIYITNIDYNMSSNYVYLVKLFNLFQSCANTIPNLIIEHITSDLILRLCDDMGFERLRYPHNITPPYNSLGRYKVTCGKH